MDDPVRIGPRVLNPDPGILRRPSLVYFIFPVVNSMRV